MVPHEKGPPAEKFWWRCPQCGEVIHFPNPLALCLAERSGGCQGCRARATLSRNPGLTDVVLDFWIRTDGWPQSPSWTDALRTRDDDGGCDDTQRPPE